jgi:two-component system, NarL family, sensor histidine kinase UhpB
LQEEERSEIARDLHDEVGPYLFAISVDVSNVTRLVKQGRVEELSPHTQAIADAVRHVQQQVRGMLGRLWPVGVTEFGLTEAIGRLVTFWQRRYPDIDYRINLARDCEDPGSPIDTTIYRVVQQCLSNAVRHGQPTSIAISIRRGGRDEEVIVEVIDDGSGLNERSKMGYGLIGMEERVRAMGGRLTFSNHPGGGFAVTAILPRADPRHVADVSPSEAAQ